LLNKYIKMKFNWKELFIKKDWQKFNLQPLLNMRWLTLVLITFLVIMQIVNLSIYKNGYPIKKTLTQSLITEKELPQDIFYVAKGILPIKSNKYINGILIGESEKVVSGINFSNIDLIGIIAFLICMHFWTKSILKYGPFKIESIIWLKHSVISAMLIFSIKALSTFLFLYSFDKDYPDSSYIIDTKTDYGWLYFSILLSFIMNIFNYGRKLQEENDLTV
jgi:Protein of unknown function (DUF2975)